MADKKKKNRVIDLDKARERICDMISQDKSTFKLCMKQKTDYEYVNVVFEYEVCGVHYDKENNMLKLIVNVNSQNPINVYIPFGDFQSVLERDIAANLGFLLRGTFHLSVDMKSINAINRKTELFEFREQMDRVIQSKDFTNDEILPILMDYAKDNVSKSAFSTIENLINHTKDQWNLRPKETPIMEITPPGMPCPHCSGILSETTLNKLLTNLYAKNDRWRERYDS
jgi:hypothetical protein